jgi:hypothetical protein
MADQLQFDAGAHVYSVRGKRVPSVTQILRPIINFDGVPPDVLAAAAEFGTHAHMACDLYNRGELDEASLDPALAPYLAQWKACIEECDLTIENSELRGYKHGWFDIRFAARRPRSLTCNFYRCTARPLRRQSIAPTRAARSRSVQTARHLPAVRAPPHFLESAPARRP